MRKLISIVAVVLLLLGVASCTNDNDGGSGNEGNGLTGELTINLGFKEIVQTRAAQSSNVVPITTWVDNIKSMMLLLAEGGTIKRVLPISLQNTSDFNTITRTFSGLPVAVYEVYVVANYDQTMTPFGSGSVTASPLMTASALLGSDISNLNLNLVAVVPGDKDGAIETNIISEPAEIFLAKQIGVEVKPDVTTTIDDALELKRAVSLLRVRINQTYDSSSEANVDNSSIDFVNGSFRLRRHGLGLFAATAANATAKPWGVKGITTTTADPKTVFYSAKKFKTISDFTPLASKYKAGADMGLNAADFTLWNEYMILPGGNSADGVGTGATKFNLVLCGMTTNASYIPADRTTPVPQGTPIYWTAEVKGAVGPNEILELNLTVKSAGITTLPEVDEYGNLIIKVDLLEWGNTTFVNLPL